MTYPNLYLEGTCSRVNVLFRGTDSAERIKSQIPQLYDALSLDLCTFYEDETYSTKTHYIFTHSATDYFLRKV